MNTENIQFEADGSFEVEPSEPAFMLLARDRHAPALIWLWALLRDSEGEADRATAARQRVAEMVSWQNTHQNRDPMDVVVLLQKVMAEICHAGKATISR
jgi:hypothetical protein